MSLNRSFVVCTIAAFGLPVAWADGPADAARKVDYRREVRTILSDKCFKCHGPDEKERKAGLRLDTAEGFTAETDSGAIAIVPNKSGESEIFKRLLHADPEMRMPPASTGKTLTEKEIATLRLWIDQGAEVKGHWAFQSPVRPDLPKLSNEAWAINAIDRFVHARL